jgi:hypothetical protein
MAYVNPYAALQAAKDAKLRQLREASAARVAAQRAAEPEPEPPKLAPEPEEETPAAGVGSDRDDDDDEEELPGERLPSVVEVRGMSATESVSLLRRSAAAESSVYGGGDDDDGLEAPEEPQGGSLGGGLRMGGYSADDLDDLPDYDIDVGPDDDEGGVGGGSGADMSMHSFSDNGSVF